MSLKKIGDYLISSTIGYGNFSKVKLGYHCITNEKVAIKILKTNSDLEEIERISREIKILSILKNNYIIQLYETITNEKKVYIIMEYIKGKDLSDLINDNKSQITENLISYYFRQLISCIEYIHTLGIAHRDIKPENILISSYNNKIKLIDFGLSNSYKHGDLLNTPCGSPCFAAPEMLDGKKYNGLFTDIWSTGVVLYFMLSRGELPFNEEDRTKLYNKIKKCEFNMPNNISDIGKDIIMKLLERNPNKRIKIDEIKKHKFYNLDKSFIEKGILIGIDSINVDKEIVKKMKKNYNEYFKNIDENEIIENVINNKKNKITVVYYLLANKNEKNNKIQMKKIFNIKNIKKEENIINNLKINDSYKNKNSNSKDNEINLVVINNFLTEPNNNSNESKNSKNKIFLKDLLYKHLNKKKKSRNHLKNNILNKTTFLSSNKSNLINNKSFNNNIFSLTINKNKINKSLNPFKINKNKFILNSSSKSFLKEKLINSRNKNKIFIKKIIFNNSFISNSNNTNNNNQNNNITNINLNNNKNNMKINLKKNFFNITTLKKNNIIKKENLLKRNFNLSIKTVSKEKKSSLNKYNNSLNQKNKKINIKNIKNQSIIYGKKINFDNVIKTNYLKENDKIKNILLKNNLNNKKLKLSNNKIKKNSKSKEKSYNKIIYKK